MIHEFDPVIYPIKLWVATDKRMLSEFEHMNGSEINPYISGVAMCTSYNKVLVKKSTGKYGFLITIIKKRDVTVSVMAHESAHIARFIWEYLCEEYTGTEADAYLIGWIAGCIEKVKRNKT